MKKTWKLALFFCIIAGYAHAQSSAIDAIVNNFTVQRVRFQSAKDVHPGYFDLKIGDNSCGRTENLIKQAEQQIRQFCPFSFFSCPLQGNYSVSSAIEIAFRGFGGAPIRSKTAFFVASTDPQVQVEPLQCGRVLASGVRANEAIDLKIEAAGSLQRLDPQRLAAFVAEAARLAGVAVSLARPTLGGQIVSGQRPLTIGGQTKPVSDWINDVSARGRAASDFLSLVAGAGRTSIKRRPAISMTPRNDGLSIAFDDNSAFELKKDYFWTLLLPRWSQAQERFRFEPTDLRSGDIDSDLKGSIGLDISGLVRSIDVRLEANMSSSDPATVARACRDLLSAVTSQLRRQDALGITWHVAYKLQAETSTARCFTKQEVAELTAFGLSSPPYPAAYGATQVAERQP